MIPRYPIYVISKGRWESRLTARALEEINCPYRIVIEPQEFEQYASVIDPEKIDVLPFSNLGLGSIPARNWVWENAIARGFERHWILDDNIGGFVRQNHNRRVRMKSAAGFRAIEDFVDRYQNMALAGMQYRFFDPTASGKTPPFRLNTRIYSCILIQNALPYRWRGRYNEDTDLSLRALKDGWCTALFIAFKINKAATMTMKGGNTDELYQENGRLEMARSLAAQHPDVCTITRKWGRWQHHVDYSVFKSNKPKFRADYVRTEGVNNYGMVLRKVESLPAPQIIARQSYIATDAALKWRTSDQSRIQSEEDMKIWEQTGFCFACLEPIEALQPGGLNPRHVDTKTALCSN